MTIEQANIYDSSKVKSVALEEVKAIIRYKDLLVDNAQPAWHHDHSHHRIFAFV